MKRFRFLLAVLALGLCSAAVGLAVGGSPAMATTAAAVQSAHTGGSVSPDDVTCPMHSGQVTIYQGNCSMPHYYSCNVYNESYLANAPDYVSNGCTDRIWLYESGVRFGYNLCISANSKTHYLQKEYTYYWVSDNQSSC